MFFFLSKILAFLFTPGFWVFTLLLLSALLREHRSKLLWWSLGVFYFFSNGFIINLASWTWEHKQEQLPKSAKYAIVLGGYSSFDKERNQVEFSGSADRIMVPLQWYHNGKIKGMILSGGSGELITQTYSQQAKVAHFLYDAGVAEADVVVEPNSKNTRENAIFTKALVDSLQIPQNELVLVTSAVHMRRSLKCFERAGLMLTPYPVDFNSESPLEKLSFGSLFIPDMSALNGWNFLFHEWFGYIVYAVMGYI
jgi:uncharacterized SAM-binding protein YcdF (DUF218 family)